MSREPVTPTNVYQPMARHYPVEEYQQQHCQCGSGHGQAPVQNITIKQADPWLKYVAMGFAGAGVALLVFASLVATLIAAGACALCVAVAVKALRGLFNPKKE
ncbi:hypothetical protein ABZV65_30825 [Streptomyces bauhiniae]|uniref:hypothetical protein n=1 Tax=Streptomyces bauhiniae TaxID=2340725 RepID=UPI0033B00BD8